MNKLGMRNTIEIMDEGNLLNIVTTLFPQHEIREDSSDTATSGNIPLFTIAELKTAACSLKNKRAPRPDAIPTEVIALSRPEMLLGIYNSCLKEGIFPDVWKEQKLVLISKSKGDPGSLSSYRPLCLLDSAGKLFERLIKPKLDSAIKSSGDLYKMQYGF